MNFEKEYFRNLIKNILIENGLVKVSDKTGYYNNNISRESYWENNFPEYKEQFFESSFDGHTEYFKLNNDDLEYIKRVLYENQ